MGRVGANARPGRTRSASLVPNFAAVQEILTPKVEGDRLVLALARKQCLPR